MVVVRGGWRELVLGATCRSCVYHLPPEMPGHSDLQFTLHRPDSDDLHSKVRSMINNLLRNALPAKIII